jgi:hypothetical protein
MNVIAPLFHSTVRLSDSIRPLRESVASDFRTASEAVSLTHNPALTSVSGEPHGTGKNLGGENGTRNTVNTVYCEKSKNGTKTLN